VSTNFYFNNFPINQVTNEQLLVEDLVIEALQIHGMDVYYLPRTTRTGNSVDLLYGEDPLKEYKTAHSIEMYLENVTGMDGEGDFISKFGFEIRDEITLLVSRRRFKFSTASSNLLRPREGDLVYVPMVQNFFEITFVEHEDEQAMFFTLGRGRGGNVYVYALKLKQYVFSNEIIETGVTEIDSQIRDHYAKTRIFVSNPTGLFQEDDVVYQGTSLGTSTAQAIVHSYNSTANPKYLDIYRVQGVFANGTVKIEGSANTATVTNSSDMLTMDNAFQDIFDNNRIETEADGILDWTEVNPFGEA
jgi:hypothetical protein